MKAWLPFIITAIALLIGIWISTWTDPLIGAIVFLVIIVVGLLIWSEWDWSRL